MALAVFFLSSRGGMPMACIFHRVCLRISMHDHVSLARCRQAVIQSACLLLSRVINGSILLAGSVGTALAATCVCGTLLDCNNSISSPIAAINYLRQYGRVGTRSCPLTQSAKWPHKAAIYWIVCIRRARRRRAPPPIVVCGQVNDPARK